MIDVAESIVSDAALKDPNVSRVTLGLITKMKQSVQGRFRVKFTDISGGLLMRVRGNLYMQDIRIYTENAVDTAQNLISFSKKKGYETSYTKSTTSAVDM
jgi:hypothetical protein